MAENHTVSSEIERRGLLQSALAMAGIPPCCMTPAVPAAGVRFEPGRITIDLARIPELRRKGAAFSVADRDRKINLILIHVEHGHYVALDRSCTHGGAQCTYNRKRRTVQCTSLNHAEYDLRGTLLHGRTHGNLRTYRTEMSGSTIEIRLEGHA